MIEKMMWVSPKTQIQQFAANDRVSACIRLTCMLPTEANSAGQDPNNLYGKHDSYWVGGQWWYAENQGLFGAPLPPYHQETQCGAGASLRPGENHEYGHTDAIIQDVWLDGYKLSDGTIVNNGNANGKFENSEWFDPSTLQKETVFSDISSIFAKWTTVLNNILYTHIGIASINNRPNHS